MSVTTDNRRQASDSTDEILVEHSDATPDDPGIVPFWQSRFVRRRALIAASCVAVVALIGAAAYVARTASSARATAPTVHHPRRNVRDARGPYVTVASESCQSDRLRLEFTARDVSGVRGRSATVTSHDRIAPRAPRSMTVAGLDGDRFVATADTHGGTPDAVTLRLTDSHGNTSVTTVAVSCS